MTTIDTNVFADPNHTYQQIEQRINENMAIHLPTKIIKFNKYKHKKSPWVTSELLKAIKTRDDKYRKWKSCTPNSTQYEYCKTDFNAYSKTVNQLIRKAKHDYYFTTFDKYKGDIKKTWRTINSILNRNRKINHFPSHIIGSNGKIYDKVEMANELNNYFCNIGQKLANKIPNSRHNYSIYLKKQITSTFSFSLVNHDEIKILMKQFKPKSSKGIDGISIKILKSILDSIVFPLTLLVNQSLMTNTFPTNLKLAKVMPLLKNLTFFNLTIFDLYPFSHAFQR